MHVTLESVSKALQELCPLLFVVYISVILAIFIPKHQIYNENGGYYSRTVINTLEGPYYCVDPHQQKMFKLNYPYTPIFDHYDAFELRTKAIYQIYKYTGVNLLTNGLYHNEADAYHTDEGVMFPIIIGGCNDTQSQSDSMYKITFDSDDLSKRRTYHLV